jgi:hypothetical protein
MKSGFTLLAIIFAALLSAPCRAQVLKPIDRTKQADIGDKTVDLNNLRFDTISQPMSVLPQAPLSKDNLKYQDVDQKKAEFNTLGMSTISKTTLNQPTVAHVNFTAKRAAVDGTSDEDRRQADQDETNRKKARINGRQIKPFDPSGEEDLKHQLNQPPLDAH